MCLRFSLGLSFVQCQWLAETAAGGSFAECDAVLPFPSSTCAGGRISLILCLLAEQYPASGFLFSARASEVFTVLCRWAPAEWLLPDAVVHFTNPPSCQVFVSGPRGENEQLHVSLNVITTLSVGSWRGKQDHLWAQGLCKATTG